MAFEADATALLEGEGTSSICAARAYASCLRGDLCLGCSTWRWSFYVTMVGGVGVAEAVAAAAVTAAAMLGQLQSTGEVLPALGGSRHFV